MSEPVQPLTFSGVLRYVDLGTGQWILETAGGRRPLLGNIPRHLTDQPVTVTAREVDALSFGESGDGRSLEVVEIQGA